LGGGGSGGVPILSTRNSAFSASRTDCGSRDEQIEGRIEDEILRWRRKGRGPTKFPDKFLRRRCGGNGTVSKYWPTLARCGARYPPLWRFAERALTLIQNDDHQAGCKRREAQWAYGSAGEALLKAAEVILCLPNRAVTAMTPGSQLLRLAGEPEAALQSRGREGND
jgi:hypothetical protein